jgi:hypothetical protein
MASCAWRKKARYASGAKMTGRSLQRFRKTPGGIYDIR